MLQECLPYLLLVIPALLLSKESENVEENKYEIGNNY